MRRFSSSPFSIFFLSSSVSLRTLRRALPLPIIGRVPATVEAATPTTVWLHRAHSRAERASSSTTSFVSFSSSFSSSTSSPSAHPPDSNKLQEESSGASLCSRAAKYLPFKFETGLALFAKRTPRPFPPPFLSPPSGSFSDPLSTHHHHNIQADNGGNIDDNGSGGGHGLRGPRVNGAPMLGRTNGDDAVFASEVFVCAGDGVGAWSTRPRGHSGLWARLILHFWAEAVCGDVILRERGKRGRKVGGGADARGDGRVSAETHRPDPVAHLQWALERTIEATGPPHDWQGTTTATGAQIYYRESSQPSLTRSSRPCNIPADLTAPVNSNKEEQHIDEHGKPEPVPVLYVTNLGDSQVMVVRPSTGELVYKTKEQWHWFDCPRQLGTNSPDTPLNNAVVDVVDIRVGDVVLAMSDGVIDNLWPHEIVENVCESVRRWEDGAATPSRSSSHRTRSAAGDRHYGDDNDHNHHNQDYLYGGGHNGTSGSIICPANRIGGANGGMSLVARELMEAARVVAVDPFAESPFMEHAIDEGLASEGGKLDDISVVAALCCRADR